MKKLYILGLMACGFVACKPNLSPKAPEKGTANFERYLAVGNSLTAGYSDGTLTRSGQENSYPAILAQQFGLVGGGDFVQPLLPGNNGFPTMKFVLGQVRHACSNETTLGPIRYPGSPDSGTTSRNNISDLGPFNNTGIPGIRCVDYLTPGYATVNVFATRSFSNLLARPIDEVVRINPTFFSCWIGSNDVLGYATNGGNEAPPFYQIPSTTLFDACFDTVITKLTRNGAKGVVMNIPDITGIPFFTTIPAKGLILSKLQADNLNAEFIGRPDIGLRFAEGANYFVIMDEDNQVRHMRAGEYVRLDLPMDSVNCAEWGTRKPIPGKYIITAPEVAKLQAATTTFNGIIKTKANRHGIPVIDINSYLKTLTSGIAYNGVSYNATFVTGGAFSLDGVHLTKRGYALVANYILQNINDNYQSTLPMVDPNKYPGIVFP